MPAESLREEIARILLDLKQDGYTVLRPLSAPNTLALQQLLAWGQIRLSKPGKLGTPLVYIRRGNLARRP